MDEHTKPLTSPLKSALKKPEDCASPRKEGLSVSFKSKKRRYYSDLLAAATTPLDNSTSQSQHSRSSGLSTTSLESLDPSEYTEIDRDIKLRVQTKLNEVIDNIFSLTNEEREYKLSSYLIRKAFYQDALTNTLEYVAKKSRRDKKRANLEEDYQEEDIETIRQQRIKMVDDANKLLSAWLEKISMRDLLCTAIPNQASIYYTTSSHKHYLFKNYLFHALKNLDALKSYPSIEEIFSSGIKTQELKEDFEQRLEFMSSFSQRYFQRNTILALLLTDYLVLNFHPKNTNDETLETESDQENIRVSWVEIKNLKIGFDEKLPLILNTLPPSIPLWQTWYLLFFHGPELLTEPDTKEVTIKKFTALYNASHQNHGQKGRELAAELMKALPEDFSSCYFKVDRQTGKRKFRTREELEQTVRYSKYNPFTRFYPTFYREAQETLEFFSHKPQQGTSPLNSK